MSRFYVGDVVPRGHVKMAEMMNFIKTEVDKILQVTGIVLSVTVHEGQTACWNKYGAVETVFTVKVTYSTSQVEPTQINGRVLTADASGKASVTMLYQSLLNYNQQSVIQVYEVKCPDFFMIQPMPVTTD